MPEKAKFCISHSLICDSSQHRSKHRYINLMPHASPRKSDMQRSLQQVTLVCNANRAT